MRSDLWESMGFLGNEVLFLLERDGLLLRVSNPLLAVWISKPPLS
jgi:hypothetical protein